MPGRSVRLFLIDGSPQGMRTAEVGNWTGLAVVSPRTELARLGKRPEVKRTGVYILVGSSEASASGLAVYVGEGDEVWSRLGIHDVKKEWWTWVVLFVSKDDNLTKAHVRWLEAAIVRGVKQAKRAEVKNNTEPVGGKLPEADAADMETFFENIRLLLPTLGVHVFSVENAPVAATPGAAELLWELKWDDAAAECSVVDGQFVVRKGSTARIKEADSVGGSARNLRAALRMEGVLAPVSGSGALLRFTQDYAFDSPSAAAAVVSGSSVNGRAVWKMKGQGITYKEWQDQQVDVAAEDDSKAA